MELFYNPDLMSEEEIKATFVARQGLVDELVSLIERQPDGAGVQHVVLIAPRGMGKTMVLLMVRLAIRDRGLARCWQVVKFPEESYGINDLADFWVEVLNLLAAETGNAGLRERVERLKAEYPDSDDLQEAALAAIKDWRRKHDKRLVLLVDNFDIILEQINDERDNARLRDALMNDGTIMLIGCATTFFYEARAYDQPLYNFFKIYNLDHLKFEQMQDLLRQRAEYDEVPNFEETLRRNVGRLRVLEYFTGGNPRLALMLYRIVTQSDLSEVRGGMEKLLDEVTPYFKAKVEGLPPQQRKILDHIARVSGRTREGVTPTEVAGMVRLTANQVSAQLKRLSELGYVRPANLRGRSSYYALSEPLYAIWHQMRYGRDAHQRMGWLVDFLKVWYDAQEMGVESQRLEVRFHERMSLGLMREARDVLEHQRYLAEAMSDLPVRANAMESVVRDYLELKDTETLRKELLKDLKLEELSEGTLRKLLEAGCINEQEFNQVRASKPSSEEAQRQAEAAAAFQLGAALYNLGRHEEAVVSFDQAVKIKPDEHQAWNNRGLALDDLGRHEEAVASWKKALNFTKQAKNWGASFTILSGIAAQGRLDLARQLIAESDLEEPAFPLARALDYLLTGDEALIEKLSPEVRGIVEEIVHKLRPAAGQEAQLKSGPRKGRPRPGPRRRTAKQLH